MDKMTWIEVMLALAGVALMCVTILIAVAAFVGFGILKKYVHTIAQQNAESQIKNFLADKAGNIKKMIVEEVKKQGNEIFNDLIDIHFPTDNLTQSDKDKEKLQ